MERIPKLNRVTSPGEVPTQRKVAELIRVPAIDPIIGYVCSDSIFSLPTHYVHPRTRICKGEDDCEFCGHYALKWYGLIAVWHRNDNAAKWVQLTSQAAHTLLNEVVRRQVPLHGLCVRIGRERKVKNAPIVIAIDDTMRVSARLPKPMDPQETIERVFGSRDSTPPSGRKAV